MHRNSCLVAQDVYKRQEVFGYIGVLKEYKTVVNEERQQYIVFAENKTISIPEIIITR